ncbi:MAG: DUF1015 domain-containing protein [Acholeplasmataceae bacterium]
MKHRNKNTIHKSELLLPRKDIDLKRWAVIACDQFTSQPRYWEELDEFVGDAPSTLRMILPEVYLDDAYPSDIDEINRTITTYLDEGILESVGPSMVLIERKTQKNRERLGLIATIDLEDYSFRTGAKTPIRATESTITSRIPPRLNIRKKAPVELSHIMLLYDDPEFLVTERITALKPAFTRIYDFDLNMNGGHLTGYLIRDCDGIMCAFNELIGDEENPLLFLAGDGNHSLATAKAHWDAVKMRIPKKRTRDHPARYAMVELVNLYDEGLEFEGIHRLVFDPPTSMIEDLRKLEGEDETHFIHGKKKEKLRIPVNRAHAYERIQELIDRYQSDQPTLKVDYIHDDDELVALCQENERALGIRMPALAKSDIFPFVREGKVLPIKSFSMGSATEKRYYLECRKITI